jgi:hypothetical protein
MRLNGKYWQSTGYTSTALRYVLVKAAKRDEMP